MLDKEYSHKRLWKYIFLHLFLYCIGIILILPLLFNKLLSDHTNNSTCNSFSFTVGLLISIYCFTQVLILVLPRKIRLSPSGFHYSVGGKKRFSARWSDISWVKSLEPSFGEPVNMKSFLKIFIHSKFGRLNEWLGIKRWSIYPGFVLSRNLVPYSIIKLKMERYSLLIIEAGEEKTSFMGNIQFKEKELEEIMRIIVLMHMANKNIRIEDNLGWATAEYREVTKYI